MAIGKEIESRGPAIVVVAVISPIIAGLFVALRIYTRLFLVKATGWEDYVSVLTLGLCIGYSVCIINATYNGMGLHIWDYTPETFSSYYYWVNISSELYVPSLLGYKLSILLTFYRLFSVSKPFRICWIIVTIFTTSYLFCNMITQALGCNPTRKYFIPSTPGTCINYRAAGSAYLTMNVLSDLLITALPIKMIWGLHLDKREKWGLVAVLCSGAIALIVAIIRWIIAVVDLFSYDRTWIAGLAWLWSILEVNTGLICGCTMVLKPLLRKKKKNTKGSDDANDHYIWPNNPRKKATKTKPTYGQTADQTEIGTQTETETNRTEPDFSDGRDLISSVDQAWIAKGRRAKVESSAV